MPRTIDEATADPPPNQAAVSFGQTFLDASPYGATDPQRAPTDYRDHRQIDTPVVPPPADSEEVTKVSNVAAELLGKTILDPEIEGRAARLRDAVLTQLGHPVGPPSVHEATTVPTPIASDELKAGATPQAKPAHARTLMLGGEGGPTNPLAAPSPAPIAAPAPMPAPQQAPAMPAPQQAPAMPAPQQAPAPVLGDPSPLSRSVVAPSSWLPAETGGVRPTPVLAASEPPPAAPPPKVAAPSNDKRTMLGMPAADVPVRAPAPPPAAAAAPPPPLKTMMGVAIPGIAPTHDAPPPPAAGTPPNNANPRSALGTMLGVAVPGIAPVPGRVPTAAMPAPPQPAPPPPPIVPAPPPLVDEPIPEAPLAPAKRGIPAIAVVGIIFAVVAVVGVGAFVLFLRGSGPLTAQPQLDETGKESLKIHCESCPDGTTIALGASSAKIASHAAVLPLPAPLSIGENDLPLKIDRPGTGRDEDVKIHVPVAYRVRADLTTLASKPPAITVHVEATPGSEASVDGKPLVLDAAGRGATAIDVSSEVEGPSGEVRTIDRKLPFVIKPKGKSEESGTLIARAGIVPLQLEAPGIELVTDRTTAAISGQTKVGSSVTVDGAAAPVDEQGRFAVRVELPTLGDKTLAVVASSPPLAPRTVRAKITRVPSLEAAAKDLDAKVPLAFDAFGTSADTKKNQDVFVEGEVIETRTIAGHSVLLVDEKKKCPKGSSCLVRIVHGEEVKAARGDSVRAYGKLSGTVTSGGKTVPDVQGVLVISLPKAAR